MEKPHSKQVGNLVQVTPKQVGNFESEEVALQSNPVSGCECWSRSWSISAYSRRCSCTGLSPLLPGGLD